jgi:hypothetical protein
LRPRRMPREVTTTLPFICFFIVALLVKTLTW